MRERLPTAVILFLVSQLWSFCEALPVTEKHQGKQQAAVPLRLSTGDLPEAFSDAALPVNQTGETCWPHIGCVKRIPNLDPPIDPHRMRAAFLLSNREQQVLVRYEETRFCTADGATCRAYPYNLSSLESFRFDASRRTVVLTPGWMSGEFVPSVRQMQEAWLSLEPANVIQVAWSGGSQNINYPQTAANTRIIARQITVLLYYLGQLHGGHSLKDRRFADSIHLVGHSLGAHISGFIGKDLAGQIGAVVGLDPADPSFASLRPEFKLERTDAQLVQVLHTNGKVFGLYEPSGHLDFYANDGTWQPGCTMLNLFCSHLKANDYYVAVLQHELELRRLLNSSSTGGAAAAASYRSYHRLFAFPAASYREFQDGSAFRAGCPRAASYSELDLNQTDITRCMVPMDFVSNHRRLRDELQASYHLDLTGQRPQLFLYAQKDKPFLNNHYLLKLSLSKEAPADGAGCLSELYLRLGADGPEYRVDMSTGGARSMHHEIIVPFMASNLASKYELAKLDTHDFFRDDRRSLHSSLTAVFPDSITISSSYIRNSSDNLQYLLPKLRPTKAAAGQNTTNGCKLRFEAALVQPLNKLSRLLLASYSVNHRHQPNIVFVVEDSSVQGAKISPQEEATWTESAERGSINLYLGTVSIGPLEVEPGTPHNDSLR